MNKNYKLSDVSKMILSKFNVSLPCKWAFLLIETFFYNFLFIFYDYIMFYV